MEGGHQLRTHCDTEVWPYLYEDHAEGMFDQAEGQFAISLWDRAKRTLILGRDRMGICPLYYTVRDGWLLWGSEIKALLASGMVPVQPDVKGIDHLFNFFCAGSARTFSTARFSNISNSSTNAVGSDKRCSSPAFGKSKSQY